MFSDLCKPESGEFGSGRLRGDKIHRAAENGEGEKNKNFLLAFRKISLTFVNPKRTSFGKNRLKPGGNVRFHRYPVHRPFGV